MRILLLSQSYAPRIGGLETVVRALARHLAARGHQVRIVTNRYPRSLPAHDVIDGVPVDRQLFLAPRLKHLQNRRFDLWLASLAYCPAVSSRVQDIFRAFRPEVVNLHFPDVMIPFVRMLRKMHRFHLVVSLHGNDLMRFTKVGYELAGYEYGPGNVRSLCALLRAADAVTACSPFLLHMAEALEPAIRNGSAIYNGIDPARFADKTKFPHPRPYLLGYGRFVLKKGFDLLIDAFGRLSAGHPGLDLVLAGTGVEEVALKARVHQLKLQERVHFHGQATPADIVRLLNGCLFLTIPSRIELFGIAALEGLAAMRPVLATRGTGMEGFLKEMLRLLGSEEQTSKLGRPPIVLVEPDVQALAEGMRTCLEARWSADAQQRIAGTIVRDYTWDKVTQIYEQVLTDHGSMSLGDDAERLEESQTGSK